MKRTSFSTLLTAVVIMAGLSINSMGAVNQISYIVHYNDTPEIGTDTLGGVTYSTVTYGDLFNDGEAGKPSLPVDYLRFSVPYNATNFCVTTTWRINVSHNLSHLLYPCQAPRWMNDTTPIQVTLPDTAAYYSGNTYPSQMAWVVDEGFLEGENHIVTVAVMPFSYSHTTTSDMVYQKKKITVMLSYELSDSLAMYPIVREDSALREEGYRLAQSMVVNPSQVASFSYSYNPPGPIGPGGPINPNGSLSGGDGLNGGLNPGQIQPGDPSGNAGYGGVLLEAENNIPYLIVTTNEFQHSIRRLAAFKRQKGYKVKIITMDQVMSDTIASQGDVVNSHVAYNDPAGKLRQYLKHYYSSFGTRYVLLTGDGVPYRYTTMRISENEDEVITLPSDLYYCDLQEDWSEGSIDFFPELFVGRIIAKTDEQINNYTDKLLRYELNPGHGDFGYLKRAFYSEGYDLIMSGEVPTVKRQMDNIFTSDTILSESIDINDHSKYPSGDDIINAIKTNNYGFISLHHHGFPGGLITYGFRNGRVKDYFRFLWAIDTVHIYKDTRDRENDDPSITNALNKLNNKWYPSIGYSSACNLMPFDTITGYGSIPMNFGESFTTGKDYGGPAFIGNTRKGYTPRTSYLEAAFGLKIKKGYYKIGVANGLAKPVQYFSGDTIAHDYTSVCQNLLGDPEFEIWTDEPSQFTTINIVRRDNSIIISGIDTISTTIGVCSNDGDYFRVSASTGITLAHVSPNSSIMFYRHNAIPFIAPLFLQNESIQKSQYIFATDVVAGRSVDSNRTSGDFVIKDGAVYEIEASGTTSLGGGFKVEKGASFAVYPACFYFDE